MADTPAASPRQYGTFGGVFTPTLLTILGVIMYLRLPWVVGNAGLFGGLLVVGLAIGITTLTGLSLSSIATNTRLGAGGPYAIISRSLGLEVGGAVGIPLYLSQALAVAMYIFGFREGWQWIFPNHPALAVDFGVFAVVFGIAYLSAGVAFRVQYVVMAVILASLTVVLGNFDVWFSDVPVVDFGDYRGAPETEFSGTDFWGVFAVFFPAATGILAGANMSGELKNPRRSIPVGTLSAIAVSAVLYVALAAWCSRAATPDVLTSNYMVMIDQALVPQLVLAGLMGATFSSALASLVGAPRILFALSRDGLVPGGDTFTKVAKNGEPRRGMLLTGVIVAVAILARDLNVMAPLITMFFLITYAVINLVMLIESSLGLVSFRPTLRLSRIFPLLGTVGCLFAMFIVNPIFSLVAWGLVVAGYLWTMQRRLGRPGEDVRSGIFVAFAEWAASKVTELQLGTARAWKPSFLVPVVDGAELRGEFKLLADLCHPAGAIKLLGIADKERLVELSPRIERLGEEMRKVVFTTWSVVDSTGYVFGIVAGLQALRSAFFRPNVLFLNLPHEAERHDDVATLMAEAHRLDAGVMLLAMHPQAGMGREAVVNLWIEPPPVETKVEDAISMTHGNLAVLTAFRLARAWKAELNLVTAIEDPGRVTELKRYLEELKDLTRLPNDARIHVETGTLEDAITKAPQSDMDVFGVAPDVSLAFVDRMVGLTRSSCLFTIDSGRESALA